MNTLQPSKPYIIFTTIEFINAEAAHVCYIPIGKYLHSVTATCSVVPLNVNTFPVWLFTESEYGMIKT